MFEEEEEERPTSPEPDVEPAPPIRLESGQTPPHEEPTSAALSNEEEEEEEEEEKGPRRLHQVQWLKTKSPEKQETRSWIFIRLDDLKFLF